MQSVFLANFRWIACLGRVSCTSNEPLCLLNRSRFFRQSLLARELHCTTAKRAFAKGSTPLRSASSLALAPFRFILPFRHAFSSARGWRPRADVADAKNKFVVLAAEPNCVYLKPERGLIRCVASSDSRTRQRD